MRRPLIAFVTFAAVAAASFLVFGSPGRTASASHMGGMDAMSIDMDPSAGPANTATTIGSQELGARMDENDILDFDEDGVDQLEVDITADGIPATNPLVGFSANLTYGTPPVPDLCVVNADHNFIMTDPFVASEPTPDCSGDFDAIAAELALFYASGDGVLVRLTLETEPGVAAGVYPLTLEFAVHVDTSGLARAPDVINNAYICIDSVCDDLDGDGVLNVDDDCPYTPAGEPVDASGCTQADVDEDFDGICDPGESSSFCTGDDSCPTYPGPEENNGCPLPGPPAVGGIAGLLEGSVEDGAASAVSGGGGSTLWFVVIGAPTAALAAGAMTASLVVARRRIR